MGSYLSKVAHSLQNLISLRFPRVETVMKVIERVPLFVNKISGSQMSKLEKAWITLAIVLYNVPLIFHSLSWSEPTDLYYSVHYVQEKSISITSFCYIWYVWRDSEIAVTLRDTERFDCRFRVEQGDTRDTLASLWAIFLPLAWCVRLVTGLYMGVPMLLLAGNLVWTFYNNSVSQVFLLKFMIVKRLQVIRTRMEARDSDIFAIFPSIRSLLKINGKINEFYSPLLFFWILANLAEILAVASDAWYHFALDHNRPYGWDNVHRGLMISITYLHQLVMLVRASVKEEVHAIDHEMDRSISDPPYEPSDESGPSNAPPGLRLAVKPLAERKKIFQLMEELMETPTEATAFGLFVVNAASLTSGLGLIVELVLVLIQLLR